MKCLQAGAIAVSFALIPALIPNVAHTTEAAGEGAGAKASPLITDHFVTPSGKIQCQATTEQLRCELTTGSSLNPVPPRPSSCDLDWGQGLILDRANAVQVLCAGDTILRPREGSTTLAYGRTWQWERFTCKVERSGLICLNLGRKGFFLSTQRWRAID